ncbi:MAG: hypothetical protein ACODAU_13180 [Myxococcota bacterium]
MPALQRALERLMSAAEEGEPTDPRALVAALDDTGTAELERAVQERLASLPAPIGRKVDTPAARRHRALRRVLAWIRERRGDAGLLLEVAREDWLGGGDHATYLRLLVEHGRGSEALAMARTLLEHGDGHDRHALESLMADAAQVPAGWVDAVRAFARAPSLEKWSELLRFTPEALFEQRVRYTLALLRRLDVPPDILFECATHEGITPEAIDLAERGLVDPQRIELRASRAPAGARPIWWGLAARAACVRGDRFNTVRLLREVVGSALPRDLVRRDVRFVRNRADRELHALLDGAGLPR